MTDSNNTAAIWALLAAVGAIFHRLGTATAHVNTYVAIWSVLALTGMILTAIWLIETWNDARDLRRSDVRDDDLVIVSRTAVRNAVGRLVVNAVFLAIGVAIVAAELGALVPHRTEIIPWGFILAILVLTSLSYADRLERRDLRHAVSRHEEDLVAIGQVAELTAQSHRETLAAIQENTEITRQADEHATAAFHEANNANLKIAAGNATVAALMQRRAETDSARATQLDTVEATGQNTNERAQDLQERAQAIHDLANPPEGDASTP